MFINVSTLFRLFRYNGLCIISESCLDGIFVCCIQNPLKRASLNLYFIMFHHSNSQLISAEGIRTKNIVAVRSNKFNEICNKSLRNSKQNFIFFITCVANYAVLFRRSFQKRVEVFKCPTLRNH